MTHTNPRIIVSSATFDTIQNFESAKERTSTVNSGKFIAHDEPEPQRKAKGIAWDQSIFPWATEFLWCLLSIILLMGLVMVLSTFNNRPLPDLPLGLTLNTIVAILATASRAVTIFLISQGIGQLKWNQYVNDDKPLVNLRVFDEASRGPWGSLQMVFRTRGSLLALLASFLVITSLASSTLTQSAIAYVPRLVAEESLKASVQYCNSYPCGDTYNVPDEKLVQDYVVGFEIAGFGAVFNNIDRSWPMLEPRCQSADCKWPQFNSLAVCVDIRNVTDGLEVTEDQGDFRPINTVSLMDGALIVDEEDPANSQPVPFINVTSLKPDYGLIGKGAVNESFPLPRNTIAFKDDKDLLLSTFSHLLMIYNNPLANFQDSSLRYRAVEVLIHFCVRTFEVEVKEGESSVKAVKSHTQITASQEATVSISGVGAEGYYELSSEDGKDTYRLAQYADFEQLDGELGRAFSGYYTDLAFRDLSAWKQQGEMTRQIGINMFREVTHDTNPVEADKLVLRNLEQVMGTIGSSMTNYLRETGLEANGTAFTSVTFVEVRWEWLTMVAAQVGLSIAFLLAVVFGTARLGVDVVKSTNMAELFALPAVGRQDGGEDSECYSMHQNVAYAGIKTEVGKDVGATLRRRREGWVMELKPRPMDA